MIASTGSKIVSISPILVSLIVSRIEALIASTASDDCKRLQLLVARRLLLPLYEWCLVAAAGPVLLRLLSRSACVSSKAFAALAIDGDRRRDHGLRRLFHVRAATGQATADPAIP